MLRATPCFVLVTSFENEMMALVSEIESYLINKVAPCLHQSTISNHCDLIQIFLNLFDTILAFDLLAVAFLVSSFKVKTYYT